MSELDQYLDFAKELALEAGGVMKRYFRSHELGTTWKEDFTPITEADTQINKMVIERVKAEYPDFGILGEEESYKPERDLVWVVDPVDGTVPFAIGVPLSTFSIALVDRSDGQPLVGVIYDPFLDELFYASKGGGCYLNGKRLKTSQATDFKQEYFAISVSRMELINHLREERAHLVYIASGCYFGARVAAGQFLATVHNRDKSWDVAAKALLVAEAGGIVTNYDGEPIRCDENAEGIICAANKTIHAKLMKLIKVPK